jgi:hypothetical protein
MWMKMGKAFHIFSMPIVSQSSSRDLNPRFMTKLSGCYKQCAPFELLNSTSIVQNREKFYKKRMLQHQVSHD